MCTRYFLFVGSSESLACDILAKVNEKLCLPKKDLKKSEDQLEDQINKLLSMCAMSTQTKFNLDSSRNLVAASQ